MTSDIQIRNFVLLSLKISTIRNNQMRRNTRVVFKSQKRVFSLGSEKIHSSCCAAGVGSEKTVTVAAGGVAVVCNGLRGLFVERVIFPILHIMGNGPKGSRGVADQEFCSRKAMTCQARIRLAPT